MRAGIADMEGHLPRRGEHLQQTGDGADRRVDGQVEQQRIREDVQAQLDLVDGELQEYTPTIQGLVTPDIDESLDEQPAKTAFWNAFKVLGEWWSQTPPY